jgi:hypothetical protein
MVAVALAPLLTAISVLSATSAVPLLSRGNSDFHGPLSSYAPYAPSCVADIQIQPCSAFDCVVDGYHKINQSLIQTAASNSWNYVFYRVSDDEKDCITDLKVFPPGANMAGWTSE